MEAGVATTAQLFGGGRAPPPVTNGNTNNNNSSSSLTDLAPKGTGAAVPTLQERLKMLEKKKIENGRNKEYKPKTAKDNQCTGNKIPFRGGATGVANFPVKPVDPKALLKPSPMGSNFGPKAFGKPPGVTSPMGKAPVLPKLAKAFEEPVYEDKHGNPFKKLDLPPVKDGSPSKPAPLPDVTLPDVHEVSGGNVVIRWESTGVVRRRSTSARSSSHKRSVISEIETLNSSEEEEEPSPTRRPPPMRPEPRQQPAPPALPPVPSPTMASLPPRTPALPTQPPRTPALPSQPPPLPSQPPRRESGISVKDIEQLYDDATLIESDYLISEPVKYRNASFGQAGRKSPDKGKEECWLDEAAMSSLHTDEGIIPEEEDYSMCDFEPGPSLAPPKREASPTPSRTSEASNEESRRKEQERKEREEEKERLKQEKKQKEEQAKKEKKEREEKKKEEARLKEQKKKQDKIKAKLKVTGEEEVLYPVISTVAVTKATNQDLLVNVKERLFVLKKDGVKLVVKNAQGLVGTVLEANTEADPSQSTSSEGLYNDDDLMLYNDCEEETYEELNN